MWEHTYHAVSLLYVKDVPEVNQDGNADSNDRQDTIDFGRPCTGHEGTSAKQPPPPLRREFTGCVYGLLTRMKTETNILVSQFAEADVAVHGHRDEEDQDRIEENEPSLRNVRVV